MPNYCDKKGMILFIVIGIIMVVVVLSTVILRVATVHARLTHHQVTRIQAQYAAKAAVIYTLYKMHEDPTWFATTPASPVTKTMCRGGCDINEPLLPSSIQSISITIYDPAAPAPNQGILGSRKISAKVDYTYVP
jgi:Tfp pilus assembly protein PilX